MALIREERNRAYSQL